MDYSPHIFVSDSSQHRIVSLVDALFDVLADAPLYEVSEQLDGCDIVGVLSFRQARLEILEVVQAFLVLFALKHDEGVVVKQFFSLCSNDHFFVLFDNFSAECSVEPSGHQIDDVLLSLLFHQVRLFQQSQHELC